MITVKNLGYMFRWTTGGCPGADWSVIHIIEIKKEGKIMKKYEPTLEEIKEANAMLENIEKAMLILNEDGVLEEF